MWSAAVMAAQPLKQVPLPRPRPNTAVAHPSSTTGAAAPKAEYHTASLPAAPSVALKGEATPPFSQTTSVSKPDLTAVKQAVDLARRGKPQDATDLEHRIQDPLARKLVEWAVLRSDDNDADFSRYRNFMAANPSWPSLTMFRKRGEAMLWQERADLTTIRAFTGNRPISGK